MVDKIWDFPLIVSTTTLLNAPYDAYIMWYKREESIIMRCLIVFISILLNAPSFAATKDDYKQQYESLTCDAINNAVGTLRTKFANHMNKKEELTKQYIALAELRIHKNCFSSRTKTYATDERT